jgi:hypothetical protein
MLRHWENKGNVDQEIILRCFLPKETFLEAPKLELLAQSLGTSGRSRNGLGGGACAEAPWCYVQNSDPNAVLGVEIP